MKSRTDAQPREEIRLPGIIGVGYGAFWRNRNRYRVVKGGRGSKKSKTTALWYIANLMKHRMANLLCIRRYATTHRDSTFADLQWAAHRLRVAHLWKFTTSPMEATYIPTGQKILFRGLDDPLKITSITVPVGFLCWHWWEEAYEIDDEGDFDTIDEALRGAVPEPLWKQATLTYNPWVNQHWTKRRFWDQEFPDTFRLTTTHKCNEHLDEADHARIEALASTNPQRYRVVGLGEYGIPGGAFFEEFREDLHVVAPIQPPEGWNIYVAIDFGLDMLAALWVAIDPQGRAIVYKELHEPGLVISEATRRLKEVNGADKPIAWYAPPDLWAKNAETGRSQQEAFWAKGNGIRLTMSKNSRETGWMAVAEWLHLQGTKDEDSGGSSLRPAMTITSNCRTLLNHLPQIKRNESKPNDCDTEPHYLTHICDALRYFCVMRTRPARVQKTEEPDAPRSTHEIARKALTGGRMAGKGLTRW